MQSTDTSKQYCLICHQKLDEDPSGYGLFKSRDECLCGACRQGFVPSKHKDVLYQYNDFFRNLLFRTKGLGDIALCEVYLYGKVAKLQRKYKGYVIVVVPSVEKENRKRGFAVLPWIFRQLNMEIVSPFYKAYPYKQATSKHREEIYHVIQLKENVHLEGRKVLLVDDVMTSGHTLQACKVLLNKCHVKTVKTLVLARRD